LHRIRRLRDLCAEDRPREEDQTGQVAQKKKKGRKNKKKGKIKGKKGTFWTPEVEKSKFLGALGGGSCSVMNEKMSCYGPQGKGLQSPLQNCATVSRGRESWKREGGKSLPEEREKPGRKRFPSSCQPAGPLKKGVRPRKRGKSHMGGGKGYSSTSNFTLQGCGRRRENLDRCTKTGHARLQ